MSKIHENIFTKVMDNTSNPASSSCEAVMKAMRDIGIPENDSGVVPAYYPVGPNPHNHHLQDADGEIACAVWGLPEGTRAKYQEDENKDETIK